MIIKIELTKYLYKDIRHPSRYNFIIKNDVAGTNFILYFLCKYVNNYSSFK